MSRWLLCLALWLALPAGAQQPVPALDARVIDTTGTLDAAQRSALDHKLAEFERSAGTQIVVLMVPSTAPEDIAGYANRVADTWKIGRRDVGDGVLLLVAKNDRRMRIEVARALEGALPDLAAHRIIERDIAPAFKAGDYARGLDAGVDALMAGIRGENLPEPEHAAARAGIDWQDLALFLFVAVPVLGRILAAIVGRKLAALLTGGGAGALAWLFSASVLIAVAVALVALVLVGAMGASSLARASRRGGDGGGFGGGWGGGGFGGRGGGGFSSGGGGSFGGGGASGGW